MDSLTQIVLGASVAELVAGKKLGNKAMLWGAIAGTLPDLDVFLRLIYHPIDAMLMHRGFSHSILFATLMAPILGWLLFKAYKGKFDRKVWNRLFFWSIITHPMLDIFTNYGTCFFWPFEMRVTFNSVFVIDPIYTVPFMICLIIILFLKRESKLRRRLNIIALVYSTTYLLYGLIVKTVILNRSEEYFSKANHKVKIDIVTPMPLTSFYWMILSEDNENYYIGYKSLFYEFDPQDIDTIKRRKNDLYRLKWETENYSKKLDFISNSYYTTEKKDDTLLFYDLRFGTTGKLTNDKINEPIMGFGMVIDNWHVQKTYQRRPGDVMKHLNFGAYLDKIFQNE